MIDTTIPIANKGTKINYSYLNSSMEEIETIII